MRLQIQHWFGSASLFSILSTNCCNLDVSGVEISMYFSKGALGEIHGTLSVKGFTGFPLEKLVSTDNGVEGGEDFPLLFPNKPNPLKGDDELVVMALPLTSGLFLSGAVEAPVVGDFCKLTVVKDPKEKRLASEEPLDDEGRPPSAAAAGDVALTCRGCVSGLSPPTPPLRKPRPPPAPAPRAGEGEAERGARSPSGVAAVSVGALDDDDVEAAAARDEEDFGLDEEEEEEGSGEVEEGGRAEEERGGAAAAADGDDVFGVGEAAGEARDAGKGTAADKREEEEEEVTEGRKLPKRWEAKVEMEEMGEAEGLRWKGAMDMTTEEEEQEGVSRGRGGRGRGGDGGSRGGCMSSKCSGTGFGFMGMCGYLSRCREKWTFKLPLVLNRFPQMLHLNGRSPV